ncbi:hypothetical protein AVEN_177496-1 [Araneus ventricosus]|uniref:Uncharacterized protein n=1 Tax=Araneus ventricosus TaxID=182803 RepID=A0A4Y2D1M1_ARAVE|nr:hypothetical protein AVEN_177496-1 [Araneus ventricosus]
MSSDWLGFESRVARLREQSGLASRAEWLGFETRVACLRDQSGLPSRPEWNGNGRELWVQLLSDDEISYQIDPCLPPNGGVSLIDPIYLLNLRSIRLMTSRAYDHKNKFIISK